MKDKSSENGLFHLEEMYNKRIKGDDENPRTETVTGKSQTSNTEYNQNNSNFDSTQKTGRTWMYK